MINKRGQALVEFVLILPIFILLVFAFIDVGRIILCKNHLENSMTSVTMLVNEDKDINEIKSFLNKDKEYDINISINEDEYINITLTTKLSLITPGMKKILNPNIKVERSIINE